MVYIVGNPRLYDGLISFVALTGNLCFGEMYLFFGKDKEGSGERNED